VYGKCLAYGGEEKCTENVSQVKKLVVKLRPTWGNIIKMEKNSMKMLTGFIGLKMWTCRGLL